MVIKVGPSPPADLAAFLQPSSLVSLRQSRHAMERYTTGLLADIPRKTAADLGRGVAGTNGQRLQEFLTNTEWDYREMDRLRMQYMVAQASLGRGLQIIDDTGFAKKGTHSVGVARQYSGTLGRVDNCQVLVTSHYVDGSFDWPIAARLYLPEGWTQDQVRLSAAKVHAGTSFKTKGEIALELIDAGTLRRCPPRRCWPMPVMGTNPGSWMAWRSEDSPIWSAFHYSLPSGPGCGRGLRRTTSPAVPGPR